ncbi:MAG TPA: hypothetical protein VGH49_20185 [Xanthobacteraceae bacterium]|jgi:hypothetical protein
MAPKPTAADSIRGYLLQLTPQTRARLLAEVERLRQTGDGLPGADLIVSALRSESGDNEKSGTPLDPAARYFFKPLEPYLVDHPSERAHSGQISRDALPAIWQWLGRDLMASMTRDFTAEIKQLVSSGKERVADQSALVYQNKAVKYLEGTLTPGRGLEQARARLQGYSGSPSTIDDLNKMLCVLKSRAPLGQFAESLPEKVKRFDGAVLEKTLKALEDFPDDFAAALPFALTLVAKRLATPWQLMRLATKMVESKEAEDVAATPYAFAVTMVMHMLDDKVDQLGIELRNERVVNAKDILIDLYDTEYAIRARIDSLEESAWGRRLDAIMTRAAEVLETEVRNLPEGLNHVLGSSSLRRHNSMLGQMTRLGWKCRDMLSEGVSFGRNLVVGPRKRA